MSRSSRRSGATMSLPLRLAGRPMSSLYRKLPEDGAQGIRCSLRSQAALPAFPAATLNSGENPASNPALRTARPAMPFVISLIFLSCAVLRSHTGGDAGFAQDFLPA